MSLRKLIGLAKLSMFNNPVHKKWPFNLVFHSIIPAFYLIMYSFTLKTHFTAIKEDFG